MKSFIITGGGIVSARLSCTQRKKSVSAMHPLEKSKKKRSVISY